MAVNAGTVPVEWGHDFLAGGNLEDAHVAFPTGTGQLPAIRREADRINAPRMRPERPHKFPLRGVPELDFPLVGRDRQQPAVGREDR